MVSTFGQFELRKVDNVLVTRLIGQLDLDTMKAATQQVVPLVKSMGGPWASLVDYTQWELYTEDTVEALIRFQEWALAHNHAVEVAVIGNSSLKKQAREKLLSQLTHRPQQMYFETEKEAWDWLVQHEYCRDQAHEKS